VLPTFKSWTVHKIIESLTLGLACEISITVQQLTFFDPPCISQKFCYHLTTEILLTYYLALYVLQPAGTKLTRIRAFIYGSFHKCVEDRCWSVNRININIMQHANLTSHHDTELTLVSSFETWTAANQHHQIHRLYDEQKSHTTYVTRLQTADSAPYVVTWRVTLSTRHFLVAIYARDIVCKYDVKNI